jgi:hypothetical protein
MRNSKGVVMTGASAGVGGAAIRNRAWWPMSARFADRQSKVRLRRIS